jgi:hypothetical protein
VPKKGGRIVHGHELKARADTVEGGEDLVVLEHAGYPLDFIQLSEQVSAAPLEDVLQQSGRLGLLHALAHEDAHQPRQ